MCGSQSASLDPVKEHPKTQNETQAWDHRTFSILNRINFMLHQAEHKKVVLHVLWSQALSSFQEASSSHTYMLYSVPSSKTAHLHMCQGILLQGRKLCHKWFGLSYQHVSRGYSCKEGNSVINSFVSLINMYQGDTLARKETLS